MVRQYTYPWPVELEMSEGKGLQVQYPLGKPLIASVYEGMSRDPNSMVAACVTGNCT